jgi:hypothetical protein
MKLYYTFFIVALFSFAANGQCFMDQHSTTWYDGWISCKKKASPNPSRTDGHWILYNLGHTYALGESYWWNNNEKDALQNGVKKMAVDVSDDGLVWTTLTEFELPMASGKPTYEGAEGPDLQGIEAKYMLLTAIENYGGSCYSFGEMKISVDYISSTKDVSNLAYCLDVKAYPNPFTVSTQIAINTNCGQDVTVKIHDAFGRQIGNEYHTSNNGEESFTFQGDNLPAGIYFITAQGDKQQFRQKLIKVE